MRRISELRNYIIEIMSNFKFYLISTVAFLISTFTGFFTGRTLAYNFLTTRYGYPHGEEVLAFFIYTLIFSVFCFLLGIPVSLIIINKLGKRWGSQLNFGGHPVLKITSLSFLSFLGLLLLLLIFYPSK